MTFDIDTIIVDIDVLVPTVVTAEVECVVPVVYEESGGGETPTVTPLEIVDFSNSSIECSFDVSTEQAEEVVKGILCGTTNPPTFENADYRLLHGQGSMDLAFAGLQNNTEYYLRPYALSNLGYKYGDVVAQRTKANPIPEEYQLVEYLQSNGSQYINTNYIPTSITKWEFDCEFIGSTQSQNGMSNTAASGRFIIANVSGLYVALGEGVSTGMQVSGIRHLFVLDSSTSSYSVDGITYSISNTFQGGLFPLFLFARNTAGSASQFAVERVYHTYLEEIGEMKVNLYPVYRKADNKPGMYDIVNNVFYTNQGTGEFTVGQDKEWEE